MKSIALCLVALLGCLAVSTVRAQDELPDSGVNYPDVCKRFSNLLGEELDSLPNGRLYLFIDEWLGVPYKYAGDCKEGVDCSGFVNRLYEQIYETHLPASSAEIYKDAKPVKQSSLDEGDLVFFKIKKRRISHVGVYLRNNKFVHASVKGGVVISDLNDPYYRKYYYKGGRIPKHHEVAKQ